MFVVTQYNVIAGIEAASETEADRIMAALAGRGLSPAVGWSGNQSTVTLTVDADSVLDAMVTAGNELRAARLHPHELTVMTTEAFDA